MADNPYQPPIAAAGTPAEAADISHLRPLADAQRRVQFVALGYLALIGLSMVQRAIAVPADGEPGAAAILLSFVVLGFAVAVLVCGMIFVFQLVHLMHGVATAIVCMLLLCVPLVGLIALLVANSGATKRLRAAGLRVGLLGVPASAFADRR